MTAKTILITGASSGIGRKTAKHFQSQGWNVVATMRTPEAEKELSETDNILVSRLDVTDQNSIDMTVSAATERFGQIDVLLNNAGYGAYGPLEAFSMEKIERQFDTNVIGLLAVTKALLPHFRRHKSGMIINVSSIGGKMTFPLGTLYHGSKFAVEGLSESLHFELAPLGIKVKIIEPGLMKTDFGGRSFDFVNDEKLPEYHDTIQKLFARWGSSEAADPQIVADVIWQAATDETDTLRYLAGEDAKAYLEHRQSHGEEAFIAVMKSQMGL